VKLYRQVYFNMKLIYETTTVHNTVGTIATSAYCGWQNWVGLGRWL